MPPSPAAASGIAPSRPTITVLVTAIAICARLAAASGPASASVARSSERTPPSGSISFSPLRQETRRSRERPDKKEGPRPVPAGPRIVAYWLCSAHAHTLRPHGEAARVGGHDEVR